MLIANDRLVELGELKRYDSFRKSHRELVEKPLSCGKRMWQPKWTESIAVGSKGFIESIKKKSRALAPGRQSKGENDSFQLRESSETLNAFFVAKKEDIGPENTYSVYVKV